MWRIVPIGIGFFCTLLLIYCIAKNKSKAERIIAAVFAFIAFVVSFFPYNDEIRMNDTIITTIQPEYISTVPTESTKDKSYLGTIKNARVANLELAVIDIQLQIINEKGEVFTSFGNYINEKPKDLALINTDYDVDCSEFIISKDDNGNSVYIFEELIPGNYSLKYSYDGYIENDITFFIDPTTIFNDRWQMKHCIKSMNLDTFYHAAILVLLDEHPAPITREYDVVPNVSYSVKYLENEFYSYLGETTQTGHSEHLFSCTQGTDFYINLEYNSIQTEVKIHFNQTHTGMAFFLQSDGTFKYDEHFWD